MVHLVPVVMTLVFILVDTRPRIKHDQKLALRMKQLRLRDSYLSPA